MIIKKRKAGTKTNYIVVNGESVTVYINKDKVSATHGNAVNKLSPELSKIIIKSLEDYPRKYLLSKLQDPNKPINKDGFESLMTFAFSPLKVSVDILRSSYITKIYGKKDTTIDIKEDIAKLMRTSVATSELQYYKPAYEKQSATCPKCKHVFDF